MINLVRYGFFSFPAAISLLIMQVYIPSYIAEMGVFSLTAIGLIFFVARLVDTISDLVIGYASDKTPAEYGRRRLWILIGTPFFLIAFFFLLEVPTTISTLFMVAALWYITGTCLIVPYYTWGAEIDEGYAAHTKYTGARVVFGMFGSLSALALPAILMPGASLKEILNFNFLLVFGCFIFAIALLAFVPDQGHVSTKRIRPLDIIKIFKKGSLFNQLIISQLINGIANALPATLFIFFCTYVLKRSDLAGPLLVVYFLSATVSVPFWVKAASVWPKERCWKIAMTIAACVFLGVLAVDENSLTIFVTIIIITGLMAGADLCLPASMLADIIDLDTQVHGTRRPGIFFAVWGTTSKLTMAFAIVIAFSLLGIDVFEPESKANLVNTKWLTLLYALLPSILKIISVAMLARYNLKPDEGLKKSTD